MFNLDQSIAEWRRQMLAAGIKTPVPMEELESHLRDALAQQMKSGLDAEPAFAAAVREIGLAPSLRQEFHKIERAERKQKFMRAYFVAFPIFYLALCLFGLAKIEMSVTQRLLGLIAAAFASWSIWNAPHFYKYVPVIRRKGVRLAIQIAGLLSWVTCAGIFMNFVLPSLNLTQSQLEVTVLWVMAPVAVISSIILGLDEAARKQMANSDL